MSQFDSMFASMGRPHLTRLLGRAAVRHPVGASAINITDAIIGEASPAESDDEDGPVIVERRTIQASSEYFTIGAAAGETWEIDGLTWDFDTGTPTSVEAGMVSLAVTRYASVNKTHAGRETR